MNVTKEQIESAVGHGINILSGEVEGVTIPYSDDVWVLKQLLISLATGKVALTTPPMKPPEAAPGSHPPPCEPDD